MGSLTKLKSWHLELPKAYQTDTDHLSCTNCKSWFFSGVVSRKLSFVCSGLEFWSCLTNLQDRFWTLVFLLGHDFGWGFEVGDGVMKYEEGDTVFGGAHPGWEIFYVE